ncbi:hypothetical protein [Pseudarthrobacter sp. NamE5]|uniref:hypothetical protein n=1 Tax=Pseudarthrobacter sp. NamE5 TaxID=2576839 RepID=UPI00110AE234|nr:hypothetical protein [Pseudarthrobacter sp. NamE5]TLM86008.1 hypothetical protein FDW84_06945 [Pseudarthrobacter sp. NamE5]
MAALQIVVRVVNGSSFMYGEVKRPVRITPNGYGGIVYEGAVYPVQKGDLIDLAGPSWEIGDCKRFLLAGADVPYAPAAMETHNRPAFEGLKGEWTLDTNDFGHYLVFNGSERLASDVVNSLESAGLAVQRWDVSYRPASDGKFYDWFARLRTKSERAEVAAQVAAVLSPAPKSLGLPAAPTVSPLEDLATRVEQLLDLTAELSERLSHSEKEVDSLRQRLVGATDNETKLMQALDRSLAYQKSLHDQIAIVTKSNEENADAEAYSVRQTDTEELLELALSENSDLRHAVVNYRHQAEVADARIGGFETTIEMLEQRLDELGQEAFVRRRRAEMHAAPRRGVVGFLDNAFARLAFVLDSVEIIANLDAPASILRALTQIDMGQLSGRDLEGLRGWREVSKLATGIAGSENMGRIYYKPEGGKVLVSVHIKQDEKEQRRHIERLRSV